MTIRLPVVGSLHSTLIDLVGGCTGLKANQQEELTLHKYFARVSKSELQFSRKIAIKATVEKHWLKQRKSKYDLPPFWSGWQ